MTTSLPSVLTPAELPLAELQAAALDGDVFPLDRAFCSIAEFDVPWRRALALAPRVTPAAVAVRLSAAWVWGATAEAPWETEILAHGHRVRDFADEIVDFGPLRVTTPGRTLVDLARSEVWDDRVALIARRLTEEHHLTTADARAVLSRSTHLPYRRRAEHRLAELGLGGALKEEGAGADPPGRSDEAVAS